MAEYGEVEKKITEMLTDKQLSLFEKFIGKNHAIFCMYLLHIGKGKWGDAKKYKDEHDLTLSDGTFRARMKEAEKLGLAKSNPIDPIKNYWEETELGHQINAALLNLFDEVRQAYKQHER